MKEFLWTIVGLAASIAWAEFTEWTPWLAKKILKAAIQKVPRAQQERVEDELSGLLDEAPGKLWKLWTASSLWWGFSRENIKKKFSDHALDMTQRGIDIYSALIFFAVFFPLYTLIYFSIRLTSSGPAHVGHTRIGKNGKHFQCYKFRTFVENSDHVLYKYLSENEEEKYCWNNLQPLQHDPRITSVGKLIRRFGLNDLPIFFNLLKGDMSIVGPMPCLERHRELYGEHWKAYCEVKPGFTGLWQISSEKISSFSQRVELDVEYVKNRSLWMNVVILFKTIVLTWKNEDKNK